MNKTTLAGAASASVAAILRNQHPSGAFVASPDFAQYRYCWLRDGSFTAFALDMAGEHEAARRFHDWCARAVAGVGSVIDDALARHRAGEALDDAKMPPARFSLQGAVLADDWPNFQLDGYGTWLWALEHHLRRSGDGAPKPEWEPAVRWASRYIAELGTEPCFDVWEEAGGSVHTATLGCVYAGLRAGAAVLGEGHLEERAEALHASLLARAARDGFFVKSDQSHEVDAALLWLCAPLGVVEANEPHFAETLGRVAASLELEGGVRRYAGDTYYGGGAWPVLTASLGLCYAAGGDEAGARRCLAWVGDRVDAEGRLAEQYGGEKRDPADYRLWVQRWGPPAADLVWSHAMNVALAAELAGPDEAALEVAEGEH